MSALNDGEALSTLSTEHRKYFLYSYERETLSGRSRFWFYKLYVYYIYA